MNNEGEFEILTVGYQKKAPGCRRGAIIKNH
jgi:hypothetical protein